MTSKTTAVEKRKAGVGASEGTIVYSVIELILAES